MKTYSHVSDQYALFATQVIPATASEVGGLCKLVGKVANGLLRYVARMVPHENLARGN